MAALCKFFTKGLIHLSNGDILWKASGGSALKVALLSSGYTPAQDTHETFADCASYEVSGTGYTARGAALTLSNPAVGSGSHQIKLPVSGDTVYTITGNLSAGARYGMVYKDTGTNSTSYLLGWVDFGVDKQPSDGTLTIDWDATGIFAIAAA